MRTGTNCSEDNCKWTIDGAKGRATFNSRGNTGTGGAISYFLATGLDGGDNKRHTLVNSSAESDSTYFPTLRFYDETRIYTGPDTPVHPGDYIAISPHYSEVLLEGEWSALNEQLENLASTQRRFMEGEGSNSAGIVGDALRKPGYSTFCDRIVEDEEPIVKAIVNGEEIEEADEDFIPLDPEGW